MHPVQVHSLCMQPGPLQPASYVSGQIATNAVMPYLPLIHSHVCFQQPWDAVLLLTGSVMQQHRGPSACLHKANRTGPGERTLDGESERRGQNAVSLLTDSSITRICFSNPASWPRGLRMRVGLEASLL